MNIGVLGPLEVQRSGQTLTLVGAKPRAVLTLLALRFGEVVPAEALVELLWGDDPPRTSLKSLQTHVSSLRRTLGEGVIVTRGNGWALSGVITDTEGYAKAARAGREAARTGDAHGALRQFDTALALWRGLPELPDTPRGLAELTRWSETHASLIEDRADAALAAGRGAEMIGELEAAVADAPLRERRWGQLMLGLYRAGRHGEALRAYQRARKLLGEELGVEPGPELVRLEAQMVAHDPALDRPPPGTVLAEHPTKAVTFFLTDIEGSTAAWESQPPAMAAAVARHDDLVQQIVAAHGGTLVKTRGEGDATFSVFERPSGAARAAVAAQRALDEEAWPLDKPLRVRMALHTGEAELRDGDYFGRAVNRAARLRSLARGGQILCSRATADLVVDVLPDDVTLVDLGPKELRDLARPEHVFELVRGESGATAGAMPEPAALERPPVPAGLRGRGPFVGRGHELGRLADEWAAAAAGGARAVLIAGEPGVGKTRLAAEWARQLHDQGALVLYGRCDEELGAPYQPFAEALRILVPHVGAARLRSIRGINELARLVPELAELIPGLAEPAQADPDTERSLLFDALVRLLAAVSAELPILIVIDDLHWAAKPTLLLLRHLLRSGEGIRLQIVATYRNTDLDRSHPLAGVLADLHRDGTTERIALGGLDADDVAAYLSATGYQDDRLGPTLSSVTSGNPFFLIEVLHHVEETGGRWDPNTLPQGVREAVSRRLSRLSDGANEALLVGAVVGSQFSLDLVEQVLERDLIDPVDEARRAGLVVEEAGNRFRFNHALVRQSLLSEVASVKRIRLHQRIAAALEADRSAAGDAYLAELARHWFECAFAGGAAKAVDYSRRAGEQAMARLAYEEAAVLYEQALQAADVEGSGCRENERAELLLARCEALLAAGDPATAMSVVEDLERAARNSPQLSAWATCYAAQLAVLTHPERLDAIAADVTRAAQRFAELHDAEGEAKAHTVHASVLARLGRVADCEAALDRALTAGRKAGNPRRVNAVLGYAPLAALWGPSPIARASGRCLDVVRVLRITTGSAAVEAVALRCQAVLEALRGRSDAAKRMLGSARRSLEALGHTHGLLETDVFAGLVALFAGEASEGEAALRRAYDGFVARGVGVDAAQAAALLARAVLASGRAEEAIELTRDSERLAGVDLQAAIAWRAARAEALAKLGRLDEAIAAARAAVDLADPTDGLLLQADAHLSLAAVLRTAGRERDAEREARRAAELYARKGATARVEAVEAIAGAREAPPEAKSQPDVRRRVWPNLATQCLKGGPVDPERVAAWTAALRDDFTGGDHRMHLDYRRDYIIDAWHQMAIGNHPVVEDTPLATLGQRHCLNRYTWRSGETTSATVGSADITWLNVRRADAGGRVAREEQFGPEDLNAALARLVELHAEDELSSERRAGRARIAQQCRDGKPSWAEDAVLVDHRPASLGTVRGREAIRAAAHALGDVAGDLHHRAEDILAFDERIWLIDYLTQGRTGSDEPFELPILWLGEHGDDGRLRWAEWYAPEQADEALARFDELVAARRPAPRRRLRANQAIEVRERAARLVETGDVDGFADLLAEDLVVVDHATHMTTDRDAYVHEARMIAAADRATMRVESLASLGRRHGLSRVTLRADGAALAGLANRTGPALIDTLNVTRADPAGLISRVERFDPADLDLAVARLIELHADDEAPLGQHEARYRWASMRRERRVHWSDDAVVVDHRPASLGTLQGLEAIRQAGGTLRELIADLRWRSDDILGFTGLVDFVDVVSEGHAEDGGPVEIAVLTINVVGDDGLLHRVEWFTHEQVDQALARFDELTGVAPAGRRVSPNLASAAVAQTSPGIDVLATLGDRHALVRGPAPGGDGALEVVRIDNQDELVTVGRFGSSALNLALAALVEAHAEAELPSERQEERRVTATSFRTVKSRWTEDAVLIDHRPASLGTLSGREAIASASRALRDLGPGLTRRIVDVLGLTGRLTLLEMATEGDLAGGGPVELPVLAISERDDAGLIRRQEWYSLEQRDEALARFDVLARAGAPPRLANAATEQYERMTNLRQAGDWASYAEAIAEDAVFEDRRRLFQLRCDGRDEIVIYGRSATDIGVTSVDIAPLAIRGERLALLRIVFRGAQGETEVLFVTELNAEGVLSGSWMFDPDDADAAGAQLDARYLTGEGEENAESLTSLFGLTSAYNRQDWAEARRLLADDFTAVDHRPPPSLFDDTRSPEAFIAALRTGFDLTTNRRVSVLAVHSVTEGAAVLQLLTTAVTAEGAEVELGFHITAAVGQGGIVRFEFFPEDQLDQARARAAELRRISEPPPPNYLANEAARLLVTNWRLMFAGDWQAVRQATDEAVVIDDRRAIVGTRAVGRDAAIAFMQSVLSAGVTEVARSVIATRGQRLALVREVYRGAGAEAEALAVVEYDQAGRWLGTVAFDPEDRDAAFDELDARYGRGEAAGFADERACWTAFLAAFRGRDWAAFEELHTEDFEFVDHRQLGFGPQSREEYLRARKALVELAPDVSLELLAVIGLVRSAFLSVLRVSGANDTGGQFETVFVAVSLVRGRCLTRVEFFAEESLEAALARLAELAPTAERQPLHNSATRWASRFIDWIVVRDWAAGEATTAEDAVWDDRRAIVGVRCEGRDEVVRYMRSIGDTGVDRVDWDVVATRGERLVLWQEVLGGPVGEVEALVVADFDAEGVLQRGVAFDPGDLDAAFDELDALFLAGEAARFPLARLFAGWMAVVNARNWPGIESLTTDDYAFVDHRPLGAGVLDRAGHIDYMRAVCDLAPDVRLRVLAVPRLSPMGIVYTLAWRGTDVNGAGFEIVGSGVGHYRGGRVAGIEFFPTLEAALERFDELPAGRQPAEPLDNNAIALWRAAINAALAAEWGVVAASIAPNAVMEDRRSGLASTYSDAASMLADFTRVFSSVRAVDDTALATRGDRLGLVRRHWTGERRGAAFEVDLLSIVESDSEGQLLSWFAFDADDLDGAYAELDARYAAGDAAPFVEEWAAEVAAHDAYNRRDWERLASLTTDDFEMVDHRPLGWGPLQASGFLRTLQGLLELAPDHVGRITAVLRIARGATALTVATAGTDEAGGTFQLDHIEVSSFGPGGKFKRNEWFAIDDLEAALGRFDELAAEAASTRRAALENTATRTDQRWARAVLADDRGALADMAAEDAVAEDRRPILAGRFAGRDAVVRHSMSAREVGVTAIDTMPVAIRGERVALFHKTFRGASGEAALLMVEEYGPDGKALGYCTFAEDDLDAAFDELDARYAAGEAAPFSEEWTLGNDAMRAINQRDWDRVASAFTGDFLWVDHRPDGLGRLRGSLDAAGLLEAMEALVKLAPGTRFRCLEVLRLSRAGTVYRQMIAGRDQEGGSFEMPGIVVARFRSDGVARIEVFADTEADAALARFEELTGPPDLLRNSCCRLLEAFDESRSRGDIADVSRLAEDLTWDDRRALFRHKVSGPAARNSLRMAFEFTFGKRPQRSIVATRGDRLALSKLVLLGSAGADGDAEIESLVVNELDAEGRLARSIVFDPDDLDAAVAELDDRFARGEAAQYSAPWRLLCTYNDAFNRRAWDVFPSLGTNDFVLDDHRPSGLGPAGGRGRFQRYMESLVELAPDSNFFCAAVPRISTRAVVCVNLTRGTSVEGAEVELPYLSVVGLRGDRGSSLDLFTLDQAEEALARYDEVAGDGSDGERVLPETTAEEASRRLDEALLAKDWDGLARLLAPDVVRVDRRAGLGIEYAGRDQVVGENQVLGEAIEHVTTTTVATRGDRLVLQHKRAEGAAGAGGGDIEAEILFLLETTDEGQIVRIVWFDPADLASAVAELDDHFVEQLASEEAAVWQATVAFNDAYNQRDWAVLREALGDDAVVLDERVTGWGALDGDAFVDHLGQLVSLAPDAFLACVEIHAVTAGGSAGRFHVTGTVPGGGEFEIVFEISTTIRGGKTVRLDLLPEGQVDEAIRRLADSPD